MGEYSEYPITIIMLNIIKQYIDKPSIYQPSTAKFWDDDHISKGMLEAHLAPEWDAATRKHTFITASADWIASIAPSSNYPKLLDLGCGPGLYAERFHQRGYQVTGIDFSRRSIQYAKNSAESQQYEISYYYQNYLDITFQEELDVITLIYCDFGVLSDQDRAILLKRVYQALKPGGKFIIDVFTPNQYVGKSERKDWTYYENGFWKDSPHICLNSFYRYDEQNTMLEQTIIITDTTVDCYNIWDHAFTEEELTDNIYKAGFSNIKFYGDVSGAAYDAEGKILCAVISK